ncbi:hypothetical protein J6590_067009 [Homalodisca vitripennis]|nr:hypothetical protein J6590_067009 [Homalodisca vitripennis]
MADLGKVQLRPTLWIRCIPCGDCHNRFDSCAKAISSREHDSQFGRSISRSFNKGSRLLALDYTSTGSGRHIPANGRQAVQRLLCRSRCSGYLEE